MAGAARRRAGDPNRMRPDDRPVHDWYRFVLSYPPHLVRDYLQRLDVRSRSTGRSMRERSPSISPIPLHKVLVTLDAMDRLGDSGLRGCGRLAMATGLVRSIGNLKFGPEVGVGRIKSDASVVDIWHAQMRSMAGDLHAVSNGSGARADVLGADAREYPRGVYKVDDDDLAVRTRADIADIADEIERRRVAMGKTSGFERMYARVVKLYFGGMARHLASLRSVLRPGARLAYVVGDQASYLRVMIRTGQLLASIAQSLGYEVTDIDLFRTRLATATREQLREEVLLLRWPGTAGRGASLGS